MNDELRQYLANRKRLPDDASWDRIVAKEADDHVRRELAEELFMREEASWESLIRAYNRKRYYLTPKAQDLGLSDGASWDERFRAWERLKRLTVEELMGGRDEATRLAKAVETKYLGLPENADWAQIDAANKEDIHSETQAEYPFVDFLEPELNWQEAVTSYLAVETTRWRLARRLGKPMATWEELLFPGAIDVSATDERRKQEAHKWGLPEEEATWDEIELWAVVGARKKGRRLKFPSKRHNQDTISQVAAEARLPEEEVENDCANFAEDVGQRTADMWSELVRGGEAHRIASKLGLSVSDASTTDQVLNAALAKEETRISLAAMLGVPAADSQELIRQKWEAALSLALRANNLMLWVCEQLEQTRWCLTLQTRVAEPLKRRGTWFFLAACPPDTLLINW